MKTDDELLVLADELTAKGDPQGEWIQVSIALAAAERDGLERPVLDARGDALIEKHNVKWRKGVKDSLGNTWFERGILDTASLEPELFVKNAKALFAAGKDLCRLRFSRHDFEETPVATWAKIAAAPELARVETLDIDVGLPDGALKALLGSKHLTNLVELSFGKELDVDDVKTIARAGLPLRRLELEGGELGAEGLRALAASPELEKLETLKLSSCKLDGAALKELAKKKLPRLASLDLSDNELGAAGAKALAQLDLPALRALDLRQAELDDAGLAVIVKAAALVEFLNLDGNYPGAKTLAELGRGERPLVRLQLSHSIGDAGLAAFTKGTFPRLRTLILRRAGCGAKGMKALAAARGLPALARLEITDETYEEGGIRDDGLAALAATKTLVALEQLVLTAQKIGDPGAAALGGAAGIAPITLLDLGQNAIGPRGAKALFASAKLHALEKLDLDENKIGPGGAKAIAGLPDATPLVKLFLSKNAIGDEGAKALAEWPGLARVERLFLHQNRIAAAGVKALAASTHTGAVEVLGLDYNKFGDEGAKALVAKKALPRMAMLHAGSRTIDVTPAGKAMLLKRWPKARV
jgi:hypothetical protein